MRASPEVEGEHLGHGGWVCRGSPSSEVMTGDGTLVPREEVVLHGDIVVCSPCSSPARVFSALGRGVTRMEPTSMRL